MKGIRAWAVGLALLLGGGVAVAAPLGRSAPLYDYDLVVSVQGSGTVTDAENKINCQTGNTGDCQETYVSEQDVTLTATPAAGWTFSHWVGSVCNGHQQPTCPFTMQDDESVQAVFTQQGQPPAQKTVKGLNLQAKPRTVEKGESTKLTASISPCNPSTQNDVIQFTKNGATIASLPAGPTCIARLTTKVKRDADYQAFSPEDGDSMAASSNHAKVRADEKKKKKGKKKGGGN